mgnify:CR=1 FL=1
MTNQGGTSTGNIVVTVELMKDGPEGDAVTWLDVGRALADVLDESVVTAASAPWDAGLFFEL